MAWGNFITSKNGKVQLALSEIVFSEPEAEKQARLHQARKDGVDKVSVREFITSPDYFNMPYFYEESIALLEEMTAPGVRGYIMEAGLGGGKSYLAAALTSYLAYRVLYDEIILGINIREECSLSPLTRVDFVNVAIKASTAKDVIFDIIRKACHESPWFMEYAPTDPNVKSMLHFDIGLGGYRIYPGNSEISSIVGQGVLASLVDEANLFVNTDVGNKKGKGRDRVKEMFDEAWSRVASRFGKYGFLGIMSSRKTINDFTARKKKQIEQDQYMSKMFFMPPRMTSWDLWPKKRRESDQWRVFNSDSLKFEHKEVPCSVKEKVSLDMPLIWVPETYFPHFSTQPEEALRDNASIPAETEEPFFRKKDAIRPDFGLENPIRSGVKATDWLYCENNEDYCELFHDWFSAEKGVRYHFHIDLALNGDCAGLAICHKSYIDQNVLFEDQTRPERAVYVDLDLAMHIRAPKNGEIEFEKIRQLLYWLRDFRGFKFGMSSFDGWQSVDSRQILKRAGFPVEYFSVDTNMKAYQTLKDLMYQDRFFFAPCHKQEDNGRIADISDLALWADEDDSMAVFQKEIRQLMLVHGKKVDHPETGSKDVSDAVAGAATQVIRANSAVKEKLGDKKRK